MLAGGTEDKGARHVTETRHFARRNRHRYRQELVPHRWPESARCHRAAAEMVARPGGGPADQILQDRPPRQHDHAGSANPERPLGADEGQPLVPTTDAARAGQESVARSPALFLHFSLRLFFLRPYRVRGALNERLDLHYV